jgi:hypothetical protein
MTKPIRDDPTQGQFQVVVSFRAEEPIVSEGMFRDKLFYAVSDCFDGVAGLSIAVREIGAGGERSELEGLGP